MNPDTIAPRIPGLQELWTETTGDARICVAVLDGPVDLAHSCFAGAALEEVETLVPCAVGDDPASRHGTHVASVIFGQHGSAIAGIAPRCRGLVVPIYASQPGACSQLDLARAINQAVARGAHVINISGGELAAGGEAEPLLAEAIQRCSASGVLIVAAAGNEGCPCLHVPAAVPSALAVGAMSAAGAALEFSNWGDGYREQGILALGEDILGAVPGGDAVARTGTSFATPVVAGIAALLLSAQVARGEQPDARRVRDALLSTAQVCDPLTGIDCRRLLGGRLDVRAARASLKTDAASTHERGTYMSEHTEPIEAQLAGVLPSEIRPSCPLPSTVEAPPALAYVLGQIGYDFGSEARRDQFFQLTSRNIGDPGEFLSALERDPVSAAAVTWTLNIDGTAVYAIAPVGPFASVVYDRLREALRAQLTEGAERVSVPGIVRGSARLMNGQSVPFLFPDPRGIYSWTTSSLVQAVIGDEPQDEAQRDEFRGKAEGIQNFLDRLYYEVRNLGLTPQERALNYAATNAFQLEFVYRKAFLSGLKLDTIDVTRSPIGRPGSDCWDVKLTFFDPERRLDRARHVFRFTIDVSDVIPVTVGSVREWDVY
jgi:subtilisin family serine protease